MVGRFWRTSRAGVTSIVDAVSFLKGAETSVNGEEMVRRARVELNANYGQEDAEWLLDNQDKIPAEFRKFYLVFPGIVWRIVDDFRCVPYLGWDRWPLGPVLQAGLTAAGAPSTVSFALASSWFLGLLVLEFLGSMPDGCETRQASFLFF